jgi:hypothetical protein
VTTIYTGYGVRTVAELKDIAPDDREDGMILAVYDTRRFYQFEETSEATNDDETVIAPYSGDGRWLSLKAESDSGEGGGGSGGSGEPIITYEITYPDGTYTPSFIGQLYITYDNNGNSNVSNYTYHRIYIAYRLSNQGWEFLREGGGS